MNVYNIAPSCCLRRVYRLLITGKQRCHCRVLTFQDCKETCYELFGQTVGEGFIAVFSLWSGFIAPVFAAVNHTFTYSVTMKTSLGFMEIELYDIALTVTVANFLKHVEGDYFDEAELYRVVT
jgi:hypothetical protein